MMDNKIIITGGGGVTGRAVARSIRSSNIFKNNELIACDIFKNKYGIFEGLFDKYIRMPHVDDEKYESAFLEVLKEENPDAILIMTEREAIFWSQSGHTIPALISPFKFSEIAISKLKLYQALQATGLVPVFYMYNSDQDDLKLIIEKQFNNRPIWLRCFEEGSTSGKGAFLAKNYKQAEAWVTINEAIKSFLISEILPGRNFACNLLFVNGELIQSAIYERLEYFMSQVAPSGITGNICVGKLVNEDKVLGNSLHAIKIIEDLSGCRANGLYTVDLKGSPDQEPMITEINLRHTAATSSFAQGGFNMVEFQLLATLNRLNEIPEAKPSFPENNVLLRDIDGPPVYVRDFDTEIKNRLIDKTL